MKNPFRRRKPQPAPSPSPSARPTMERPALAAPLTIRAYTRTDPGCERALNEDAVRYAEPPPGAEARGRLVVLADGMGGHAAGEVASQTAVTRIAERYYAVQEAPNEPPATALVQAFHAANAAIHALARADGARQGMGTTATALAVLPGGQAVHAQVGDSHLYLFREGALYLLSEDHSLVMEMVRQGALTRAEAARSDDRNVILRALGTHPRVEVSGWPRPLALQPGDRLLLCTDGLYELVEEEALRQTLARTAALNGDALAGADAVEALVGRARAAGGPDNITAALLTVDGSGSEADAADADEPAPSAPSRSLRPTRAVPQPHPDADAPHS